MSHILSYQQLTAPLPTLDSGGMSEREQPSALIFRVRGSGRARETGTQPSERAGQATFACMLAVLAVLVPPGCQPAAPAASAAPVAIGGASPLAPAQPRVVHAQATQAVDLVALNETQRAAIRRTRVPVRLPADPRLARAAFLTSEANWFAASIKDGDVTITIEANRTAIEAPEITAAFAGYAVGTRAAPRIGHNELIIEAAWLEDGVAWSLEVECLHPDTNPRCVETAFVRSVVAGLTTYAVGRP